MSFINKINPNNLQEKRIDNINENLLLKLWLDPVLKNYNKAHVNVIIAKKVTRYSAENQN